MSRKLVASLACRNQGKRLYGKPLQNLDIKTGTRIIDNIIACLQTILSIDDIVLGISEGEENFVFKSVAEQYGIKYIFGNEIDVLSRLIKCCEEVNGTDVFRITTESPFLYFESVEMAWAAHLREDSEATFMWDTIDGTGFEILSLEALRQSHRNGEKKHRSELCSLYIRENLDHFRFLKLTPPQELIRHDLRLTVDYPEDLIICRAVFEALKENAPRIKISDIVKILDQSPHLIALTSKFTQHRSSLFGNEKINNESGSWTA
jgi:spore coat polysaccharide biosynthesis protein SpsF